MVLWKGTNPHARKVRIIIEAAGLLLIIIMLMVKVLHASAQEQREDFGREIALQQYTLDAIAGHGGRLDRIEQHLDSTDKSVSDLQSESWEIRGGLLALGVLQSFGLLRSFRKERT